MPIAIQCAGCKQRLRVPDKVAGKRIKCPKCQTVLPVPKHQEKKAVGTADAPVEKDAAQPKQQSQSKRKSEPKKKQSTEPEAVAEAKQPAELKQQEEAAQTAQSTPAAEPEPTPEPKKSLPDRWYLKAEDSEDYGPVLKAELDQWRDEGRITADCHVLQDGAEQWQWASDVYPELEADEAAPAAAGPPPLNTGSVPSPAPVQVPAPVPAQPDSPAVDPSAFQFAAADASPSLRARGRKRVRKKVVKKSAPATSSAPAAVTPAVPVAPGEVSPKSRMVAGLLGIFLGVCGVHRFYLGYTGLGLVMLFTCGGCGIWSLIDAIMVFMGNVPDAQGRPLRD